LPQIRGQLRYHLGEIALAHAAGAVSAGQLPVKTNPPGGVFIVARIGRFALVSLTTRKTHGLPRRSMTRKLMSQRNFDLEPQQNFLDPVGARGATELAYFGCLVAVPWKRDPTVPAELAIAIPNASLSDWLTWMPLHFAFAQLQARVAGGTSGSPPSGSPIPDNVFPRFRLPKRDDSEGEKGA
jgi:hypothetical protein